MSIRRTTIISMRTFTVTLGNFPSKPFPNRSLFSRNLFVFLTSHAGTHSMPCVKLTSRHLLRMPAGDLEAPIKLAVIV